jgi:hypothetical protein
MIFISECPSAGREAAAPKLGEIAKTVKAVQNGKIFHRANQLAVSARPEGRASRTWRGLDLVNECGWL